MKQSRKQFNSKTILAIESSCDETAVAFLEAYQDRGILRKSFIASQKDIHAQYGGVVPEVAARSHIKALLPLINAVAKKKIPDVIAVTAGPGLITSLLVGVHTARTLSYLYKKPLIRINHIEGHVYANWLQKQGTHYVIRDTILFPALALIVSGGHTELILMKGHGIYHLVGKTLDDAAGEAFDKVAQILGLSYPGGPAIAKRARFGEVHNIPLPIPMSESGDYFFSFSGLKTAVLYRVRDIKKKKQYSDHVRDNLCAAFQHSVVSVLVKKTTKAAAEYGVRTVLMGGGVAANLSLRHTLEGSMKALTPSPRLVIAPLPYCTDNAAMIAAAAFFRLKKKRFASPFTCIPDPLWEITNE